MRATSGIFRWRTDAERASRKLRSTGLGEDRVTLLVPGDAGKHMQRVPVSGAEQPGVGKALGAVVGAAMGMAAGFGLGAVGSAAIPGNGSITAIGVWGVAILGLMGAAAGTAAGSVLDHAMTEGLPVDEWFVYQDAMRKGRSVVIAFPDGHVATESARALMITEGAESIDEARKHWWIGLRSAEREQYSAPVLVTWASSGKAEVIPFNGKESRGLRAGTRSAPPIPR